MSILLLAAVILTSCGQNAESKWQAQYDLGVRYLLQGSYEEAIIAFATAMEIAPRRAEAYEKAAKAYEALGRIEEAQALLERALQQMEDETLRQLYLRLCRSNDPFYTQLTQAQQDLLTELTAAVLARDWQAALAIQSSRVCQELVNALPENETKDRLSLCFYPDDRTQVNFFRKVDEGKAISHMDIYQGANGNGGFLASVYSPEHYYMNVASFIDGAISGPMTSYIHHVQEGGSQYDFTITGTIQNGAPAGTLLYTYSNGQTAEYPPEGYNNWPDWPAELTE